MDYLEEACGGLEAESAVAKSFMCRGLFAGLIFRVMK